MGNESGRKLSCVKIYKRKKPLDALKRGGRTIKKGKKNLEVLIINFNRMIGKFYGGEVSIIKKSGNNKYWITINMSGK